MSNLCFMVTFNYGVMYIDQEIDVQLKTLKIIWMERRKILYKVPIQYIREVFVLRQQGISSS